MDKRRGFSSYDAAVSKSNAKRCCRDISCVCLQLHSIFYQKDIATRTHFSPKLGLRTNEQNAN